VERRYCSDSVTTSFFREEESWRNVELGGQSGVLCKRRSDLMSSFPFESEGKKGI